MVDVITTSDVLPWLKAKMPDIPVWGVGAIDKTIDKVVGVYTRPHGLLQPKTVGLPASYGIKSITLLVHWGKMFTPCEETALDIYAMLSACSADEQIRGRSCWVEARTLPVVIGKDSNGFFEASVDFDLYVRKE